MLVQDFSPWTHLKMEAETPDELISDASASVYRSFDKDWAQQVALACGMSSQEIVLSAPALQELGLDTETCLQTLYKRTQELNLRCAPWDAALYAAAYVMVGYEDVFIFPVVMDGEEGAYILERDQDTSIHLNFVFSGDEEDRLLPRYRVVLSRQ